MPSPSDNLLDFTVAVANLYITTQLPQMDAADKSVTVQGIRENLEDADLKSYTMLDLRNLCADLIEDWLENQDDLADGSWEE